MTMLACDLSHRLAAMTRPRLLLRAARFGVGDYRRERDLRRLIGMVTRPQEVLSALIAAEEEAEATRQAGDANYSPARHIEILIALLAEARLHLPAATAAGRVPSLPGPV
jgi:hypothetical protein